MYRRSEARIAQLRNAFCLRDHARAGRGRVEPFLGGNFDLAAAVHRGVDLGAHFHVEGGILAEVPGGDARVTAALAAALSAGIQATAAFPIDLFSRAGLVARVKAEATAAAYLNAQLEFAVGRLIERAMTNELKNLSGVWLDLLRAFLEEVTIEAGVWAKAAYSAEVMGEVIFAGALIPLHGQPPGFTCSVNVGAGLGFATGFHFVGNVGMDDPARLLDRVEAIAIDAVKRALATAVESAPPGPRREAIALAATFLDFALPLIGRSLFRLALRLKEPDASKAAEEAAQALAADLIAELQRWGIREAFYVGIDRILAEFGSAGALADIQQIVAAGGAAASLIDDVIDRLRKLARTDLDDPAPVLALACGLADAVMRASELPLFPAARLREAAAITYASATLLAEVIHATRADSTALPDILAGSTYAAEEGATTAYIAGELQKTPGSPVRLADLAVYLAGRGLNLRERAAAAQLSDWLAQMLSGVSSSPLLTVLLQQVHAASSADAVALLDAVAVRLGDVLAAEVIPVIHDAIPASERELHEVVDQIVAPTLVSLARIVLPGLKNVHDETGALKLREQISAVLLQTVGQLLITTTDILLDEGLTQGSAFMIRVADEIDEEVPDWVSAAIVAALPLVSFVPTTPADAERILRMAARVMREWNQRCRQDAMAAAREILQVGLSGTGVATVQALATSNDPPSKDRIVALSRRLTAENGRLIADVGRDTLDMALMHYVGAVGTLVGTIGKGVELLRHALEHGYRELERAGRNLREFLEEQEQKLTEAIHAVADAIAHIAEEAAKAADQAIDAIRDALLANAEPVLRELPSHLRGTARGLLSGGFDALRHVVNAPLVAAQNLAGAVRDEIAAAMRTGHFDRGAFLSGLKNRIVRETARSVSVGVDVPGWGFIGVSLDASTQLGVAFELLIAQQSVRMHVDAAFSSAAGASVIQAHVEQARDAVARGESSRAAAQASLDALRPPARPVIEIRSPAEGALVRDTGLDCVIRIRGVNRSFLVAEQGLPVRVAVLVNGETYPFDEREWVDRPGGALELRLRCGAGRTAAVPLRMVVAERRTSLGTREVRALPATVLSAVLREREKAVWLDRGRPAPEDETVRNEDEDAPLRADLIPALAVVAARHEGAAARPSSAVVDFVLRRSAQSREEADPFTPALHLRRGLNVVQVGVATGEDERPSASAARAFYFVP